MKSDTMQRLFIGINYKNMVIKTIIMIAGLFSLSSAAIAAGPAVQPVAGTHTGDREYWVSTMTRIAGPVYENLSRGTLRRNMPVETAPGFDSTFRSGVSHLEALGRSFCGMAPWLNLPPDDTPEGKLRSGMTSLVIASIRNAVDPSSPDYMPFDAPGRQPLVDAAFLAQGLLRSRERIWPALDSITRVRLIGEFKASRAIKPHMSNWLLFPAMVEAALLEFTGECDMEPVAVAITMHRQWYKGDGWYGDGEKFHLDYYNSFVIQPMMVDIMRVLCDKGLDPDGFHAVALQRLSRHAAQLEMMISPEGTYPVLGRSMGYRFGAFHALSQAALLECLPDGTDPARVRGALSAVLRRQLVPATFDRNGWLTLGFCGHQPGIAEEYVSTGSAYLCMTVFLPLGLAPSHPFWSAPAAAWPSVEAWSGHGIKGDKAIPD